MSTRNPTTQSAPRKPPVKYFSILHGAALMVGTHPGPRGDDLDRKWTLLDQSGRILPANDMALRYFLFGESGCEQIGAQKATEMAAKFGGSLQVLITGEAWPRSEAKNVIESAVTQALLRRAPRPRKQKTQRK
ncbi:MAG: hypothetical protein ABI897_05465 [Spartobacteria bacterium]